jgi:imidazolonepropionase-like amidohydrolase
MKLSLRFLLVLLSTVLTGAIAAKAADAPIAFVNATVLPMDSDRVLPGHTVVVQGDRIVQVGPNNRVTPPTGARRIDATGKFLLPGLGEMHGHNPPPGSSDEYVENVYFLYVANGVTTVRSMLGWPGQLELREKVRRGEILGPTLLLAGPSFSGHSVHSPQAAEERVREQKAEGWDLLKIHPGVRREVFDAMAATARAEQIEFSGHVPAEVGLHHAIAQGQVTIDHLDGYIEALQAEDAPVDRRKLDEIVRHTVKTNTWVVPTMALWETILGSADLKTMLAYPELRYMPKDEVERWRTGYERRVAAPDFNRERARQIAENRKVLLQALSEGGARIIFGTDAPQVFSVPGYSIHREWPLMAEAGMSNAAILRSATRAVGEYLAATDSFGTVAPGQRADLLLLEANPLEDLRHLTRRAGVMVRGQWLPEKEIQERLRQIERWAGQ